MFKSVSIFSVLPLVLLVGAGSSLSSDRPAENRVLTVVQKMDSSFKTVEDYTCEVEQIFYQDGVEDQRHRFKFYFKRAKRIRVDFSHPYPSLTIFYQDDDSKATVIPFRFLPSLKFQFSIDNPLLKTLAGQRINQTDMGYFIEFLAKNLGKIKQGRDEFHEDGEQIKFLFWAMDYIHEKNPEKYQIYISKRNWLPIRIERFNLEDKPLEATFIKNYTINTHLEDKLFIP